jgi:hypothetical protein
MTKLLESNPEKVNQVSPSNPPKPAKGESDNNSELSDRELERVAGGFPPNPCNKVL